MTPMQIKTAMKVHQLASEKEEDYDLLAKELNLDIEADAEAMISENSPTGSRQILRKYNIKHEYVPLSFSDLTTPTPRHENQGFDSSKRTEQGASAQRSSKEARQTFSGRMRDHSSSSFCSSDGSSFLDDNVEDVDATPRMGLGQLSSVNHLNLKRSMPELHQASVQGTPP